MKGYKVVTSKEMARIEALALQNGCNEEEFIHQAGLRIAEAAIEWIDLDHLSRNIVLLVGKGNKGGDAFAAGLALLAEGFQVKAYHLAPLDQCRPLCKKYAERFRKKGGDVLEIQSAAELSFDPDQLIIDGIFGTGFAGPVDGLYKAAIERANASQSPILAIDIPSGLNGTTGETGSVAIEAHLTVALGLPKAGFFLRDGWNYVGRLRVSDFGLPAEWIDCAEEIAWLSSTEHLRQSLPKPVRNRHKYQAGCVVAFAGSPHFSGAAKLASLSALRGGAGIVKLFYPKEAAQEMIDSPYEVIRMPWSDHEWNEALKKASSVFIGPGLGKSEEIISWLAHYIPKLTVPVVLDADALIPSVHLAPHTICTPHRGEALRFFQDENLSEDQLLMRCQRFCDEKRSILVLKGAPTWVFVPSEKPFIIAHGDPGMATAGSGDVLTGLIAALLAQGCPAVEASVLGVMLHALSGEAAAEEKTSHCMIASDLIEFLPRAFQALKAY